MKSEFALAFNQICSEYNLPRDTVLEAVRAALVTAYRRDWKVAPTQNVTAEINIETGLARIYVEKIVVEEVTDPDVEISLADARNHKRDPQINDLVIVDVTPRNFGRIAAQTAKQVITQRLREAERESQFTRFSRQEDEIIIGTVQSISPQGITLHLERTEEAFMPKREQIPGERYTLHQKIRVYVTAVRRTPRGPEILASRSHPRMLGRLLELEVPEIRAGQVEIKAIAREAGTRSKLAVATRQAGLDPVGACVGMRGIRIQTISRELHGERIDVIEWNEDPITYISNALSLQPILSVVLDEGHPGGRTAAVVVIEDQLSLAIGRAGQNARLAAKLTNWRVDIQGATEAAVWALEEVNKAPELLESQKALAPLVPRLAAIMRTHEADRYPYTDEERKIIKTVVEGVRNALIARRDGDHPGARQARARMVAQEIAEAKRREAHERARARVPEAAYAVSLSTLEISEKLLGHLERNGIKSVGQVMERMAHSDEALLILDGMGVKGLNELKAAVDAGGFALLPQVAETSSPEGEPEAESVVVPEEVAAVESNLAAALEPEPVEVVAAEDAARADAALVDEGGVAADVAAEPAAIIEEGAETDETRGGVTLEQLQALKRAFGQFEADDFEDSSGGTDDDDQKRKKKEKRSKHQTLVYDDESGETILVRKRRRGSAKDLWDDYSG